MPEDKMSRNSAKKKKTKKRRRKAASAASFPPENTETSETSRSGSPVQGCIVELSTPTRESLRWEGVLEDPEAEEKRLELYRTNRRQRYVSHREALDLTSKSKD